MPSLLPDPLHSVESASPRVLVADDDPASSRFLGDGMRSLGAQVDIWHCDALGLYSGVSDPNADTREQDFLRGFQRTDANGAVQFQTIYPGWYSGRAVHIHFTIRTQGTDNGNYQFT